MWHEIKNESELQQFMDTVDYFHDGCLKEFKYLSGAYVNSDLSMHPVNDQRILQLVFQQQNKGNPVIELEFQGLKFLNLVPTPETYSCEISECAMFFKDGYIYWYDDPCSVETDLNNFEGIAICALKVRWRTLENSTGSNEYYKRIQPEK